eukprot:TRINITY_DN4111_c0_g1_i2.p1 TRINITY_DN4111_c0_g1~~TRINITY_DN4111_c0_g1_i2.p1  ORF type:complete len:460 (+),score=178.80 TRINITY_DN4111_c0_g1_i2:73-1380(+)
MGVNLDNRQASHEDHAYVSISEGTRLLEPEPEVKVHTHHDMGTLESVGEWFFESKFNLLVVFFPFAVASFMLEWGDTALFGTSVMSLVALSSMLSSSTEQISLHLNQSLGALLNVTFGNAIEMIIATFALSRGLFGVVKYSLLGSIVSNGIWSLGVAFLVAGRDGSTIRWNRVAVGVNTSVMFAALFSYMLPCAASVRMDVDETDLVKMSHYLAMLLLASYFLFLLSMHTHSHIYDDGEEQEEQAVLSMGTGIVCLSVVTVSVCAVSEWVCDSIGQFALNVGMSPRFVAFILLPLAGNLPEFVTVVSMAAKGKMDLCVGVAIGSAMQVAVFVVPMLTLIGWGIGQPLTMNYGVLETAVLFLCILKAFNVVSKKEATWIEGATLVCAYASIAIAFWFWIKNNTPDEVGPLTAPVPATIPAVVPTIPAAVARVPARP